MSASSSANLCVERAMRPYYDADGIAIYHGDSRDVLPDLEGDFGLVLTDPPYSVARSETEFAASGNIAVVLHEASKRAPSACIFGTASGRGYEFLRSSVRALPHCRTLAWHRRSVSSPAAGPWRWDLVMIHVFGRGAFGKPAQSSLIETDGTQALARETGHRSPVPTAVMEHIYRPFAPCRVLDPFLGSGASLLAVRSLGGSGIGIEIDERYCEIAARRLSNGLPELEVVA